MVKHPEVQKKAQEEIHRVIGQDRLPTFEDRDSLPYVESILIEVLRLRPPVSAGMVFTELLQLYHAFIDDNTPVVTREAGQDDVHHGFLVERDTVVIVNFWCVLRRRHLSQLTNHTTGEL